MKARDLLKSFDPAALPPVMLFCPGKAPFNREPFEPLLAERLVERIADAAVDPSMRDMAYTVYHADETPPGEIVVEAQTLPFLAERRVVVVRNCAHYNRMSGEKNSPLAALVDYIKNPADTTLLLLVAAQIDKRKAFYKACAGQQGVVECPQLDDAALADWVREEVEKRGKSISRGAVAALLDRTGARLSDVTNAVQVVCTYSGENEGIEEEDVAAACSDVAEETVWNLTDAIAASQPETALKTLNQLLELGKSPDEIMGIVNWLLENAYKAHPESGAVLDSKFVGRKVTPLAQKLGLTKLKAALRLCTDTHFMLRTTGVDTRLAVEMLIIKLSYRPKRRRAAS